MSKQAAKQPRKPAVTPPAAPDSAGLAQEAGQAVASMQQQARQILAQATFGSATHDQFVRSADNVRKKPRDLSELLGLVRAQGLLQNLVCYAEQQEGRATGRMVVAAGDGRWQVIGILIAEGSCPADYQIPYRLVTEQEALLVSLAETWDARNCIRPTCSRPCGRWWRRGAAWPTSP